MHPMWVTFGIVYAGIALGRFPKLVLDRTGIALLGAIAMLTLHGVHISEATDPKVMDYHVLFLLFGMMIFSAQLRVAGFYVMAGAFLTRLTDRPRLLLAGLIATGAGLSALLVNDIVCLALTPLLCQALLAAKRDPVPYLVALATSSNIGSAATLIGNPQNMYIGTTAGLPFAHFTLVMLPVTLAGLVLCYVAVTTIFGKRLYAPHAAPAGTSYARPTRAAGQTLVPTSLPLQTRPYDRDTYLIVKTLVVLGAVVAAFLTLTGERATELRATAALAGAGVLLCSHRAKAARLYQLVDWNLILLFIGLFIVNGAMKQHRLTDQLLAGVSAAGLDLRSPVPLSAVTAALSNVVSNVPAVMLLEPSLPGAGQEGHRQLWYLVALVSTWAGNLTLVGSIANLIVAESAAAFGVELSLRTYCRVGVPLTVATLVLGVGYLVIVF